MTGSIDGVRGVFPENYVELMRPAAVPAEPVEPEPAAAAAAAAAAEAAAEAAVSLDQPAVVEAAPDQAAAALESDTSQQEKESWGTWIKRGASKVAGGAEIVLRRATACSATTLISGQDSQESQTHSD